MFSIENENESNCNDKKSETNFQDNISDDLTDDENENEQVLIPI